MDKSPTQTAVIILGMHRSGTSCLAGSLQQKGLFLGEVFEWNPFNRKGNRENERIMKLNDSVLSFNDGNWDSPPTNMNWDETHIEERNEIVNLFVSSKKNVFGFKDPRSLFTFPFWIDRISNVKMVGSFRNPLDVAVSLKSRNGWPIIDGLKLWERYNLELISLCKSHNVPLANFDVGESEYMSRVSEIAEFLQLDNIENNDDIPFYDKKLISNKMTENYDETPQSVQDIYSELLDIYKTQRKKDE